ncbi:hypothetical protein OG500_33455 [Kitasatospora sp. NBC_01250]|uniref:hypothetical protein n=1 Tax=Kitasatospora sp. NBC_01250 TaxID=2903571 RepID=UPI002E353BC7|nr:hypothetical protein [Kitasatospora sp. NBC_01250]
MVLLVGPLLPGLPGVLRLSGRLPGLRRGPARLLLGGVPGRRLVTGLLVATGLRVPGVLRLPRVLRRAGRRVAGRGLLPLPRVAGLRCLPRPRLSRVAGVLRLARVLRLPGVLRLHRRVAGLRCLPRPRLSRVAGVLRLARVLRLPGVGLLSGVLRRGAHEPATTLRSCWNAV